MYNIVQKAIVLQPTCNQYPHKFHTSKRKGTERLYITSHYNLLVENTHG